MRVFAALVMLTLGLTACLPEEAVMPSLHDVAIFSNAADLRGLYGYIYGEAGEVEIDNRSVRLTEGRSDDPLAVKGALLIDGDPYLHNALPRLTPPPTRVQRIPLTSDVQLEVGTASGALEVAYFDGTKWFTLAAEPSPSVGRRVVPRERLEGLRSLGALTLEEARTLEAALAPRAPVAVTLLEPSYVPRRRVAGLPNYRRTALYVQQTVPTDDAAYSPPARDLIWEVVASGNQAGAGDTASFALITSEAELISAWNRAYASRLTPPPLPDVDFRRETLIAFFQATQTTGGYGLEVQSVSLEGGDIYVDLLETQPPAGAITTQALTTPWVMLRVLRGDISAAWLREASTERLIGVARRTD